MASEYWSGEAVLEWRVSAGVAPECWSGEVLLECSCLNNSLTLSAEFAVKYSPIHYRTVDYTVL